MIQVKIDEKSYAEVKQELRRLRQQIPRAAVSGISKSLTKVKQLAVDKTYEVLNLTKSRITEELTAIVEGDINSDRIDDMKIILRSTGEPIGLVQFMTNAGSWKQGTPLKFKFYRSGETHSFKHGFLGEVRGKIHAWERSDYFKKNWKPGFPYASLPAEFRYPVDRLIGLRIQDIQDKPGYTSVILADGGAIVLGDIRLSIEGVIGG